MPISDEPGDMEAGHRLAAKVLPSGLNFIDGEWVDGSATGILIDPSTGGELATFALAHEADVDAAVAAAREAFPKWRSVSPDARRTVLVRLAAGLRAEADTFATILALEGGQPTAFARAGVMKAADYFEYYAGWVDKLTGLVHPTYPGTGFDYSVPQPFGVVAAIPSWNGPITGIGRKVAPALAAGNCVVLKSSETVPFSALHFAAICSEVGVPSGVVNCITGGAQSGSYLASHPGVDKITFTGGSRTGRAVMTSAASELTPVTLELGGKSANVVFADADLDAVGAIAGINATVRNSGQGCLLPSRLLIEDSVYDEVVERVLDSLADVRIGDPLNASTTMGPVVNEASCTRILSMIDAAKDSSATLLIGGERLEGDYRSGYFIPPTVFGDVDPASALAQEEVFGPVLAVSRFHGEDEAIAMANSTRYSLAGYVFTRDFHRAHRVAEQMDAGYVSVNGVNPMAPTAPFGGFGESGFGKEGGLEGLTEFVKTKNIYMAMQFSVPPLDGGSPTRAN